MYVHVDEPGYQVTARSVDHRSVRWNGDSTYGTDRYNALALDDDGSLIEQRVILHRHYRDIHEGDAWRIVQFAGRWR